MTHEHKTSHGSLLSYLIGFTISIILTCIAFALVYLHIISDHTMFDHTVLYGALLICAIIQLFVQISFFLHVGKESKSHWNMTALSFALVVVLILVGGTLWIMQNLQHTNMTEPFENGVVTPQTED